MPILLQPIGVIHTPFTDSAQTPIQSSRSTAIGQIEVFAEFIEGLQDIEDLSHLILLYVLHRQPAYALCVQPFLDDQLHGVFATRYPQRPNFIGLSIVRLRARSRARVRRRGYVGRYAADRHQALCTRV